MQESTIQASFLDTNHPQQTQHEIRASVQRHMKHRAEVTPQRESHQLIKLMHK